MNDNKLLSQFILSTTFLTIITAILYFWGYLYYAELCSKFGFSVNAFSISFYEYIIASWKSVFVGVAIGFIILCYILFFLLLVLITLKPLIAITNFFYRKLQSLKEKPIINRVVIFINNNTPKHFIEIAKERDKLIDKIAIFLVIFLYVFLFLYSLSWFSISQAKKDYYNLIKSKKKAVVKFKNSTLRQDLFYITHIGDKVIFLDKNQKSFILYRDKDIKFISITTR